MAASHLYLSTETITSTGAKLRNNVCVCCGCGLRRQTVFVYFTQKVIHSCYLWLTCLRLSWVWPAALKSFCILRLKLRFHVIFSLGSPAEAKSWSIFVQREWKSLNISKYTKNQSLFYGCLVAFGVRIQNRNRHIYYIWIYNISSPENNDSTKLVISVRAGGKPL